jgi:hypothetical protein
MPFPHQNLNDLIEVEAYDGTPSFVRAHRARGRKGMGLRYEAKVHAHFAQQFDALYVPSMWFSYRRVSSPKIVNYAQPDAFLIDFKKGLITIVEVKYNHTSDAYFQLLDKYVPLLDKWLHKKEKGLWQFAVVEVVYWYDKFVSFPTKVALRDDITKVKPGEFGVHIWRPTT